MKCFWNSTLIGSYGNGNNEEKLQVIKSANKAENSNYF